jgi:molybdopterin-guanine dinucleotide biosynthesis protein A
MGKIDAIILAGGLCSPEMSARTGTPVRALFGYQGKPFVTWVYEALRASSSIERIAVVGPEELSQTPGVCEADLLVPESETIESNLFGVLARMLPEGRILITACDNPLLTTEAFDDLISRSPENAAVCCPVLRHEAFLRHFPRAKNVGIQLRDGKFIGGGCAIIHSRSIPKLQRAILAVLAARKSKQEMIALLGWKFALRFTLKRVTTQEVEDRACAITGLPIRLIRDCSPLFPIDIDDPEDWDYLMCWKPARDLDTTDKIRPASANT